MTISLKKKHIFSLLLSIPVVLMLLIPAAGSQDFEGIQIHTVQASENIYMLMGGGGNIGILIGDEGIFMIDCQFGKLKDKISAAIKDITDGTVKFLCNTNWHYDHSDGNSVWGKEGAVVLAHAKSRKHMLSEWTVPELDPKIIVPPSPKEGLPVIVVDDSLTIYFNDEIIQIAHFPNAHSDGDLVFYFTKSNVIHTGDIYFSGGFPFMNVTSGGTIDGMIAASAEILNMIDENTKVIPGHGPISNQAELQGYHDMLKAVKGRILSLIKEGKTLEQVLAEKPLKGLYEKSDMPDDIFTKTVYMDLSKK